MFEENRIGHIEMEIIITKKFYQNLEERKSEIRTRNYLSQMSDYYIPFAKQLLLERDGVFISDDLDNEVFNLAHTIICNHKDSNILDEFYNINRGVIA